MKICHVVCLLCVATYRLNLFKSTTTKCSNCKQIKIHLNCWPPPKKAQRFPILVREDRTSDHTEHPSPTEPEVPVVFDQWGAGSSRGETSVWFSTGATYNIGGMGTAPAPGAVAVSDPAHLYPLAPGNVLKLAGSFQPHLRGIFWQISRISFLPWTWKDWHFWVTPGQRLVCSSRRSDERGCPAKSVWTGVQPGVSIIHLLTQSRPHS